MNDMPLSSEERTPDPDGFEQLVGPMHDPYMKRVFKRAREFNAELLTGGISRMEAVKMRAELNRLWNHYMHMLVTVTGRVEMKMPAFSEPQEAILPGVIATSHGFDILDSEDASEVGRSLHLLFLVRRTNLDGEEKGIDGELLYDEEVTIRAGIDNVLVEASTPHPEHAKEWLMQVAPAQIAEIESRIANAEGDETAAILSLKGLRFTEFPNIDDDFTRECLNVHLGKLITVDQQSAYAGRMEGVIYRTTPDESLLLPDRVSQPLYGYASRLKIVDARQADAETPWFAAIGLSALPYDMAADPDFLMVPLDSIPELISLRHEHAPRP